MPTFARYLLRQCMRWASALHSCEQHFPDSACMAPHTPQSLSANWKGVASRLARGGPGLRATLRVHVAEIVLAGGFPDFHSVTVRAPFSLLQWRHAGAMFPIWLVPPRRIGMT